MSVSKLRLRTLLKVFVPQTMHAKWKQKCQDFFLKLYQQMSPKSQSKEMMRATRGTHKAIHDKRHSDTKCPPNPEGTPTRAPTFVFFLRVYRLQVKLLEEKHHDDILVRIIFNYVHHASNLVSIGGAHEE